LELAWNFEVLLSTAEDWVGFCIAKVLVWRTKRRYGWKSTQRPCERIAESSFSNFPQNDGISKDVKDGYRISLEMTQMPEDLRVERDLITENGGALAKPKTSLNQSINLFHFLK